MSATAPKAGAPARVTRANGRASREAILAAAIEVFAENGYVGTTMAEIARRVGMTQPGLLHHFPSKDALLLAVVETRTEEQRVSLDAVMATPEVRLDKLLMTMGRENLAARMYQHLFTTLSVEAIRPGNPAHAHFVERYRQLADRLARHLVTQGVPRTAAPQFAREILATLDGLHHQWLLDPDTVDLLKALTGYGNRLHRLLDTYAKP